MVAAAAAADNGRMSTTEAEGTAALESYVPFTPFQDSYAFEPEAALPELGQLEAGTGTTPFLSEYFGEESGPTAEATAMHELLDQLYDEDLDEVLAEMADEAWSAANERIEMFGESVGAETAEQFLDQWVAPLREQAETMLDNVAEAAAQADIASMDEEAVDRLLDPFAPTGTGLEQYFEDFLGGLFNKAKTLVKKAASLAQKGLTLIPGVGAILNKLKALVRPLLNRVLRGAIDRLPPALRPVARQLSQRLLGNIVRETDEAATEMLGAAPASPDPSAIQQQFDLDVASLLFLEDIEADVLTTEAANEARSVDATPIAELHEARARFADELERGTSPEQALENFLPAVMAVQPIARAAIGIIGRQRVVNFLAGFLAKLIGKYVPAAGAKQLSQAIVDTGLRLVSLETPSEAEVAQLAPDALAATVEDTVRRIAELDEATLEHPALLEAAAVAAFHEAAAENFPSQLLIPELREASEPGTWVSMPLGRRRHKHFKKYTRVFDVQLTPQMAEALKTFGGTTITAFLKDRLGAAPPVQARVHLYQATTATSLARIARVERGVPGLATARRSWTQFHPLTPEAAGLLLQQPGLGRAVPPSYRSTRGRIAVGQRFYLLEIAGAASAAGSTARRSTEVNITLDFAKDEYRVFVYLGESDAQQIAAKVRARDTTAALVAVRKIYEAGVASALGGDIPRHVKIVAEALPQEQLVGTVVRRLTDRVRQVLAKKVAAWVGGGIADHLSARAADFLAATEDPKQGVTIVATIVNPPGAPLARKLVRSESLGAGALADIESAFKGQPKVTVATVSGFRFD
jgi:hypothetical protein